MDSLCHNPDHSDHELAVGASCFQPEPWTAILAEPGIEVEHEFTLEATLMFNGFGTPQHHGPTIIRRVARELYLQFGGTVWIRHEGVIYDGKDVGVHEPALESEGVQRVDQGEEVSEVPTEETAAGT